MENKNNDRFNYSNENEFEILEMQCEKCVYKHINPLTCEKFIVRKPSQILRCESLCSKFSAK